MRNTFLTAFLGSLAACLVTSLGIYTIRRFAEWGRQNTSYFMSFAAGVLVSASFLHVVPKALSLNPSAPVWLLTGFFGLHVFNRFLTAFVCERNLASPECAIGVLPMLGIGFHSFVDGFIYSIAFTVSLLTGLLAATGMVLHEFPEGMVTYLLLRKGGFSDRRAAWLSLVGVAATTPAGMLVSYPLISRLDPSTLGALLSGSAGALIYVGATHLLPRAEQERKPYSLVALAGGIAIAAITVLSKV